MILEFPSLIILSQSKNFDTNAWEARVRVVCEFVVSFISHHLPDEQPFSLLPVMLRNRWDGNSFSKLWMNGTLAKLRAYLLSTLVKASTLNFVLSSKFFVKILQPYNFHFLVGLAVASHCGVWSCFHVIKSMKWADPWTLWLSHFIRAFIQ